MRSIWKGHIRFLLVAIPVRVYNALETSEKIQFNQLHREDYGPIGYDKRCKKCGEIVTNDQITKGYQYEPDRWAIVEPDDVAKIKIKTTKAVDIVGFVNREEIPTTFYDSPYFAGPDGAASEKPYALLREVMKETGKVGVGKVVLRDREDLVAIFPHEDGLVLQKLHYPHELRKMEDVPDLENVQKLDAAKLNKNELKLATTLVQEMATTLTDIDTADNYHEALRNLIDSKIKGRQITEYEVEEVPRLDIMSDREVLENATDRVVFVVAAVNRDVEVATSGTADRERAHASLRRVERRLQGCTRNQYCERCEGAAVDRKIFQSTLIDNSAHFGLGRLHERCTLAGDCDRLADTADFQVSVCSGPLQHVDYNWFHNVSRKALRLDFQAIVARNELSDFVVAVFTRGGCS